MLFSTESIPEASAPDYARARDGARSRIIVQKYGGSSLSSLEKVCHIARKIVGVHDSGRPVVVVVSAMGDTTSQLIDKAKAIASSPSGRELDMLLSAGERVSMALLAMAIQDLGRRAISLTGPQSGIQTDANHANASIHEVRPERVLTELAAGNIVIVAGYQGASQSGEVTTLGRGGSDTTAVALAAALRAEVCEIYSDVAGVYTADPRLVEEPLHLKRVDSLLMSEYARHGARVLHPPCLEQAREGGVPLRALSTFGGDENTTIAPDSELEYSLARACASPTVVGVTSRRHRLRVEHPAADQALERAIRSELGELETFAAEPSGRSNALDLLVDTGDLPDPEGFARDMKGRLSRLAEITPDLTTVSVVARQTESSALREQVVTALIEAGTPALSTYAQPLSVTCAIRPEDRPRAVRALHERLVEAELGAAVSG